jgi:type 1 glutamine amidotransferase
MKSPLLRTLFASVLTALAAVAAAAEPIKVLIIDGRNNHDWVRTTESCKATLEATGRFKVDVSTAPAAFNKPQPAKPKAGDVDGKKAYDEALKAWKKEESDYNKAHAEDWNKWVPKFAAYAVIVNNYNGPEWGADMKDAFTEYVLKGGGLVNVHAANNAFTGWDNFNEMICAGWRGTDFEKRVAVDDATGKAIAVAKENEKLQTKGFGSGHGAKHVFTLKARDATHPVMQGIPTEWLHASDELYHRMRGSPDHMEVLESSFSSEKFGGTEMHEPMVWWAKFNEGRVVTTSMGHLWVGDKTFDALPCVGFQTILARSTEWAATGKVTIAIPEGFPTTDQTSIIEPSKVVWKK